MKKLLATSAAALAATVFLTSCGVLDNPSKAGMRLAESLMDAVTNEDENAVSKIVCSDLSDEVEYIAENDERLRMSVAQAGKAFMNPDKDDTYLQVFIIDIWDEDDGDFQSSTHIQFRQKADKSWCIEDIGRYFS